MPLSYAPVVRMPIAQQKVATIAFRRQMKLEFSIAMMLLMLHVSITSSSFTQEHYKRHENFKKTLKEAYTDRKKTERPTKMHTNLHKESHAAHERILEEYFSSDTRQKHEASNEIENSNNMETSAIDDVFNDVQESQRKARARAEEAVKLVEGHNIARRKIYEHLKNAGDANGREYGEL